MDCEQKTARGSDEMVPRARFEQLQREHGALAIMVAAYFGAFISALGIGAVAEFVGWGIDPQSRDGSGTVVYLRQRIVDRKTMFVFRLAPEEGEVARAVLLPFSGDLEGAAVDSREFPTWLGAIRKEFSGLMDQLRRGG